MGTILRYGGNALINKTRFTDFNLKNMKKIFYYILSLLGFCLIISACEDWTETESLNPEKLVGTNKSDEYYARLRAYKASDHPVSFGWFGNWTGKGASLENCMTGLPDSVDFISMWGGWKAPTEAMLQDLRYVQEKKGTKALVVFLVLEMGDQITPDEYNATREDRHKFWGWIDGDEEAIEKSIVKFANAICDTIDKYNYDGFDLDWENGVPQPFPTNYEMGVGNRISVFIETMAKRIGPKSGTGRYFVIDGVYDGVPAKYGPYFNYFITQAYGASSEATLNSRMDDMIKHYADVMSAEECAKKFIVTESFEQYTSGGADFTTPDGRKIKSLEGMARWNPVVNGRKVRKGGVGTYHMEYEFSEDGYDVSYPYLRKATQIMNPAVK